MKSQVTRNTGRQLLRWRLKALVAEKLVAKVSKTSETVQSLYITREKLKSFVAEKYLRVYKRLVIAIATEGLLALCCDLSVDEKDQETINRRSKSEENFITECLPTLGKHFDRCLANGYFSPVDQFRCRESGIPIFLGSAFGRVFGDDGKLMITPSVEAVRIIRQVCFYAYKLDLPYGNVKEQRVISNFKQTEDDLRVNRLKPRLATGAPTKGAFGVWGYPTLRYVSILQSPQAKLAAELVQRVFADYQPAKLQPKHGPGVTANVAIHQKWTSKLNVGCPVGSLASLYWFNTTDALDRLNRYPTWGHRDAFTVAQATVAKVLLVPKDSRGPRLISAEPAERQFLQQGIKREMVRILESNPLTAGRINFADQTVNQRLALETSLSREWATLDLKDASDRVTTDLVDFLFGETLLKEHMFEVRSTFSALPGGEQLFLHKYAPMGSALCFPVLATSVWALAVTAVASRLGSIKTALEKVFVYGDDLIVPAECASDVMETLESYLLKVNREKSFVGTSFAESCGMDAFMGERVTPIRLRSVYCTISSAEQGLVKAMVSMRAHAQELQEAGYKAASEYWYSLVEEVLGPLPYATDKSPYLGRLVAPEDWFVLQSEWAERNGKRVIRAKPLYPEYTPQVEKVTFTGYYIQPARVKDKDTDPWSHMYRTHVEWGTGDVSKWGDFTSPRKFALRRHTYKVNSFECGVYGEPKWVEELMLPARKHWG